MLNQTLIEQLAIYTAKYKNWILAVSGGSDSLAMLHLVYDFVSHGPWHPKVVVATVDHGSGPMATFAPHMIKNYAERMGFTFITTKWEHFPRIGIQEKARKFRYRFFADLCKSYQDSCLLTAHQMQDNAETVLINLERGSGLHGACGILPAGKVWGIPVIRPMLGMTKCVIRAYLSERNIPWIEDPANELVKFRRVFYRKKVLSLFDELYQKRLELFTSNMREIRETLDHYVAIERERCVRDVDRSFAIDANLFSTVPPAVQRLLIAQIISDLTCDQVSAKNVSAVLGAISREKGTIVGKIKIIIRKSEILLSTYITAK